MACSAHASSLWKQQFVNGAVVDGLVEQIAREQLAAEELRGEQHVGLHPPDFVDVPHVVDPGDGLHARGQFLHREHGEGVFGIVVAQGEHGLGLGHTGEFERFAARGVGGDNVGGFGKRRGVAAGSDDGDRHAPAAQLLPHGISQARRADDDVMVLALFALHFSLQSPFETAPDQRPDHDRQRGGKHRNAHHDHRYGEHSRLHCVRHDVAIADRGHGLDGVIKRRGQAVNRRRVSRAEPQAAQRAVDQQAAHAQQGK